MQRVFVKKRDLGHCAACGGVWLDFGRLESLAHHDFETRPAGGSTTRRCARCRISMTPVTLRGVAVETCGACRGLYLDEGELDTLLGRPVIFPRPKAPFEAERRKELLGDVVDLAYDLLAKK
jgi:Zn-finger nucleic acid-binding protein